MSYFEYCELTFGFWLAVYCVVIAFPRPLYASILIGGGRVVGVEGLRGWSKSWSRVLGEQSSN